MPQTHGNAIPGVARPFSPEAGVLATLCYQSRTPKRPDPAELDDLLADARDRNKRFGVTGMLVHEGDRYFQWLEGPSSALEVLWNSISRDERHQDIEILGEGITPARLFSEWDLRFLERSPTIEILDRGRALETGELTEFQDYPALLAKLALAGDDAGMEELLRCRRAEGADASTLCRTLFEPAAHRLGDWWCEDICSSFDITLALGKLQSLVRRQDASRSGLRRVAVEGRSILVSPPPRETHMLGATLLGGFFQRAGWSVQAEFPQDDPELLGLVSAHWFDALALTMSDVFTRQDRLSALIQTIKDVRTASRNPKIAVIVGGRAFRPSGGQRSENVGADVHYKSAGNAVSDLDYWLFMNRAQQVVKKKDDRCDEERLSPLKIVQMIVPALALRVARRAD